MVFVKILNHIESYPFSWPVFFLATLIVACFRGIQEAIFFRTELYPVIFMYCTFYMLIGTSFVSLLSKILVISPGEFGSIVILGIFSGLLPPLFDLFFFGFGKPVTYHYYLDYFFESFYYFSSGNETFPPGELVTIWLVILSTGLYVGIKSKSFFRLVLGTLAAYMIFFLLIIIPSLISEFYLRVEQNQNELLELPISAVFLVFIQGNYFIIRKELFIHLRKRVLHILPVAITTLLGAVIVDKLNYEAIFISIAMFMISLNALIQNDFYDQHEDAFNGRKSSVIADDVLFSNVITWFIVLLMILMNKPYAVPFIIFCSINVLYNYPFSRLKKYFPFNMMAQAMWGGMALLSGILLESPRMYEKTILIVLVLFMAGWSVIALWRDLKDIRGDAKAGIETGYLFLRSHGLKLSQAHRVISILGIISLLVPAFFLSYLHHTQFAIVLWITAIMPQIFLTYHYRKNFHYQWFLGFQSLYLSELGMFFYKIL